MCTLRDNTQAIRLWVVYALALSCITALFFGSLRHHLLNTHDADSFADHILISEDASYFFSTEKYQATGRLVADGAKYLIYLLYGNNPAVFHLAVVIAHWSASLVFAVLIYRLQGALTVAMLTGLLFLINVAHFEAIHHISALDYPLGLAFACSALLCWERGGPWAAGAFALFMVLAIQSHPSLAALWVMPLYNLWKTNERGKPLYHLAATALPIAAAVIASILLASHTTSTWLAIEMYNQQSIWQLIYGQVRVFLFLSSRLLSTAHWIATPIYSQATWEWIPGLVAFGGLLYLLFRREAPYDWAALWVLIGLLPYVLMTESTIEQLPAGPSRYLYVASAGSSLLLATALRPNTQYLRYVGMILITGLTLSSYIYLRKVEAISYYTSSRYYASVGDFDRSTAQMERSFEAGPDVVPLEDLYIRYIINLMDRGDDVQSTLSEARKRFPDSLRLLILELSLQATSLEHSDRKAAVDHLKKIFQTTNNSVEFSIAVFYNLGGGFIEQGQSQRAIYSLEIALVMQPGRTKTLCRLGYAYATLAEKIEPTDKKKALSLYGNAINALEQCVRIDPQVPRLHLLAAVYTASGRTDSTIRTYQHMLRIDPTNASTRAELGKLVGKYAQKLVDEKSTDLALLEQTVELGVADDQLLEALAKLYIMQGHREKALQVRKRIQRNISNSPE